MFFSTSLRPLFLDFYGKFNFDKLDIISSKLSAYMRNIIEERFMRTLSFINFYFSSRLLNQYDAG